MNKPLLVSTLCVTISTPSVLAEVYQWVDSFGQRHYSDRLHQGAEVIEIHPGYAYYGVKRVFDGDTLLLANGQKVRFLGINTPEVEGRNKSAEPGGEEAKRWLETQIAGKKLRMETDMEKKDKYGRLLAHVFTEDGIHLNLELVRNGLAAVVIHPPNLRYSQQLLAQQSSAEHAKRGIWGNAYYASQPYQHVQDTQGWKRVTGTLKDIKKSRKYVYVLFSDNFSIRIGMDVMDLFPDLTTYLGKSVEVRGWVNKSRDGYLMPVRHPGSIQLLKGE